VDVFHKRWKGPIVFGPRIVIGEVWGIDSSELAVLVGEFLDVVVHDRVCSFLGQGSIPRLLLLEVNARLSNLGFAVLVVYIIIRRSHIHSNNPIISLKSMVKVQSLVIPSVIKTLLGRC
jgi:hypothetical protein